MKRWKGLGLKAQWWLVALLASLLVTSMTFDHTSMRIDNLVYDLFLRLDGPKEESAILLVVIDENSLRRVGRWPWRRATHAALVERLADAKPRAIAYDVLFTEPGDESQDAKLGKAIAAARPLFLPMSMSVPGSASAPFDALLPIPPLRKAASGMGYTNLDIGADGVVRAAALTISAEGQWLHLMELVRRSGAPRSVPDQRARMIPYAGEAGYWPAVSAASILQGEVPSELLRGKIILVGATAPGLGSQYPVPVGGVMSGLEIQANLLHGLLGNRMIGQASVAACLALALLPLWGLMIALGPLHRLPALASFGVSVAVVFAISAAALMLFRSWLPPSTALAGLLIAYPLWGWRQLAVAQRFMRSELERFEQDPAILSRATQPRVPRGAIASTIALLRSAIARNREMRHFVTDRLDQLPDATLITDLGGHVVLANAAAKRLFGDVALDGKPCATLLPRRFQGNGREAASFPPEHGGPASFEAKMDDGRFFSIRMAEQTSTQGERLGWVIRFVDISEAKAAQRQREDIVHLLTHDMRSPQASILAILETANSEQIGAEASARIRHYAERTLGLADGFVQLARAENLEYVLEEVDLRDMLMDAIDDLWPQSKVKYIDIKTFGEGERLLIAAERSLLTRVLGNVIGNAIKYSGAGTTICCTLGRESNGEGSSWARCAIADQGPGLAPEQRQKIFERFHRGPMGLGPKVDGVGLGLSFVHTVLMRHGGEIRCESVEGGGSTFTLFLPLAPTDELVPERR